MLCRYIQKVLIYYSNKKVTIILLDDNNKFRQSSGMEYKISAWVQLLIFAPFSNNNLKSRKENKSWGRKILFLFKIASNEEQKGEKKRVLLIKKNINT